MKGVVCQRQTMAIVRVPHNTCFTAPYRTCEGEAKYLISYVTGNDTQSGDWLVNNILMCEGCKDEAMAIKPKRGAIRLYGPIEDVSATDGQVTGPIYDYVLDQIR
jgi:hypothetical protein